MKYIPLILLLGIFPSSVVQLNDAPTGHPLESRIEPISSFGMRYHPVLKIRRLHTGVDFMVPTGTPVYATADGAILAVEQNAKYGKYIRVTHEKGFETLYAHLDEVSVAVGKAVKKGDQIGLSGNTGTSQRPHLHYEIREHGNPVDPDDFLPLAASEIRDLRH